MTLAPSLTLTLTLPLTLPLPPVERSFAGPATTYCASIP